MLLSRNQAANLIELLYVESLGREKRKLLEMGEDFLHQIFDLPYFELESAIGSIWANGAAFPQILNLDKQFSTVRILTD